MIYDHVGVPPPRGSILEMLLMMVQMRRESADLFQTNLLVQAMRSVDPEIDNDENVKKAMENYMFSKSPYLEADMKREDKKMLEEMRKWTKLGPIAVQAAPAAPMQLVHSKLAEKSK